LHDRGGELALREISRRKPCPKNRVKEHIEKAVAEIGLEKPAFGQVRVANELTKRGLFVSPTGVRSVWLRHDLETFRKRLKALEAKAAQEHMVLTDESLRGFRRLDWIRAKASTNQSVFWLRTKTVGSRRSLRWLL
jgi:hypothetical protein